MGTKQATSARPALVLVVMCVGMFLVLLDITVVNVALPAIIAELAVAPDAAQWVIDGYSVATAGLLLAAGTLGDRVGHRRVVLGGLALFGLASLACALAPTAGLLIAARAVQGAGAALLLPTTLALITAAYPAPAARARALGVWAGITSLALPAGPLLGGMLVSVGGWRLVFLVNIPIVAAALVAVLILVAADAGHRERSVDVAQLVAAATALGAVTFAVIDAGHHGLRAAGLVAVVVAIGAGAATVLRQHRARHPLLPRGLLSSRAFVTVTVAAPLMNVVMNGTLYVTTLFLQVVEGRSALQAGLALLPLFLPLVVLAPVAGRLTARFGPRLPMLVAAAIGVPSGAALLLVRPGVDGALVLALLGLGTAAGLFTAPVVTAAVRAVPPERSGLATGLNTTARQTGTALGVAVLGAVAGAPSDGPGFTNGLHTVGLIGAAGWALAFALSAIGTPRPEVAGAVATNVAGFIAWAREGPGGRLWPPH